MPINPGSLLQYPPQLLAQIARGAFHPAPLMPSSQAPGLTNMPQPQWQRAPGFNPQAGLDSLSRASGGLANGIPTAQDNGMSVASPTDTMAAYNALPPDYTQPGLQQPALQQPGPVAGSGPMAGAAALPTGMPDFLSGAPAGVSPQDWALLQSLGLRPGMPFG